MVAFGMLTFNLSRAMGEFMVGLCFAELTLIHHVTSLNLLLIFEYLKRAVMSPCYPLDMVLYIQSHNLMLLF